MCQLENSSSSFFRFRPHIEAGLEMTADLEATHLSLEKISSEKLKIISDKKLESNLRLEKLKSDMTAKTIELKSEIRVLQDDLEKVVTNGIRDEIETIQQVVFDFDDAEFIHDPTVIQVYIQQLFRFVKDLFIIRKFLKHSYSKVWCFMKKTNVSPMEFFSIVFIYRKSLADLNLK